MVKRDVYKSKDYVMDDATKQVIVPTYFYPVNSAIYIEGNSQQMVVMNDRPQGGSAYKDGRIELMLIR